MRACKAPGHPSERGTVLMFVLLSMGLITVVTVGMILFSNSDLAAGIRQVQSVRVFNVAEAGVHQALARLRPQGADSYAGETVTVTDGSTTLGTAVVQVWCLDEDGDDPDDTPPCEDDNDTPIDERAYRRIVSNASLPVGGGTRRLVVVVQGYPEGAGPHAVCAYDSVIVNQGITVYGDVGSDGTISLQGPAGNAARIRADPNPPTDYAGNAIAGGAITCSQGCASQVEGLTSPNAPLPVCPPPTLPTFSPGSVDQMVTSETTWQMNSGTGLSWDEVTVQAAGRPQGCTNQGGQPSFTTFQINSGSDAAGVVTVNIRKLTMGRCGRLMIIGVGRVILNVSELTDRAIEVGQRGRFGVGPSDVLATPAPISAERLVVNVRSTVANAVWINRASVVSGIFKIPYGEFDQDQLTGETGQMYGAVLARVVDLDQNLQFEYDPDLSGANAVFYNFTRIRSWKDQ